MNKPNALIRTDGNSTIGYGHAIRMLALAKIISKDFSICLLIKDSSEWIKNEIVNLYQTIEIPEKIDINAEADFIAKKLPEQSLIFIIDGYSFNTDYQRNIREKLNIKTISIDDYQPFKYVVDAVINHAGFIHKEQFQLEPYTKLFTGPQYAIIRSEYNQIASQKARIIEKVDTAFICFGGTDPDVYDSVLMKLNKSGVCKFLIVVNNIVKFEVLKKKFVGIELYSNLSAAEMISLMKTSEIAVLPSSTLSYEYSSVGGGLFIIQTADNQKYIHNFLIQSGCAFDFNDYDKVTTTENFLSMLNKQVSNQKQYFNGKNETSLQKVVFQTAFEGKFKIRKAANDDLMLYFDWANDPEARQNSFNKEAISLETHAKWFLNKISSNTSALYIFVADSIPLGNIRFDFSENKALLSYTIDKNFRGKGLGSQILQLGIEQIKKEYKETDEINGYVHQDNQPSLLSFKNAGFVINNNPPIAYSNYNYYSLYLAK